MLTEGFFSLRYFPTPERVPPDPTPKQTMSTYNWYLLLIQISFNESFRAVNLYLYFSYSLKVCETREHEEGRDKFFNILLSPCSISYLSIRLLPYFGSSRVVVSLYVRGIAELNKEDIREFKWHFSREITNLIEDVGVGNCGL